MKKSILIIMAMGMLIGQVDYGSHIQTIFNDNCTSCHQYGSNPLNLTTYSGVMNGGASGASVVAGDHANSLLWQKVNSGAMPQDSQNLSSEQINVISQWIDEGALETPAVDVTGLFFSEYAEGSEGSNKYVEIYNGTGSSVDLSDYQVWGSNNGGGWKAERQHDLTGTLSDGDVYVLAADAASQAILDETDLALAYESALHYNGDDAIGLAKDNGTGTFELIDVIGVPDVDPGSGWDVSGTTNGTEDHTLIRKSTVVGGNANWSASAGTDTDDSEWLVDLPPTNDYTPLTLGSHLDDVASLFFSEYAEGSGNHKYLEIYNGTGASVTLTNFQIAQAVNGGGWLYYHTFPSNSSIADGDVWVITNDQADASIQAVADEVLSYPSVVHHNGNDSRGLISISGTDTTWIDIIGDPDNDPGSGWDVAGVTNGTMDHTLVRKSTVTIGNTDWSASAGTTTDNSEWIVLDQDTWDYVGSHPHTEMGGPVPPIISSIAIEPLSPTEADDVTVSAAITDDGTIASATLTYNTGSTSTDVAMAITTGDTYTGTIPAQVAGTTVTFLITAVDNEDSTTTSAESSYLVISTSGEITAIHDIQYTTDSSGDSPLNGQTVTISGIVTTEFWGSGNGHLYVQDDEGGWNGIIVYQSGDWDTFDFLSSTGIVHSVAEGDSVTLTGTVNEYFGLTQILDVTEFIIHGHAAIMIEPTLVTPTQVMTDGADAEKFESCLIAVQDVAVDDPDVGNGEWSVTDGTDTVRVDDRWDYYFWPEAGQELDEVVGCLDYSFGNTKIQPRLARDVVEADGAPVRLQRIQQVLYSDLIKAGEDEESDMSYMVDETVTIEGIVTMPSGLSYAGAGVKFIFADVNGGPWSAILSYDPDSSAFPTLFEGDLIQATGYIAEYSTGPANMTELFITEPINIIDFEQPLPAVNTVNTGDLRWPTEAEQWGNVMVRIEDAIVTETTPSTYEPFVIDDSSGEVWIDDDSDSIKTYLEEVGPPPVGSLVQSMEGWVYHHFGSNADSTAYKLCPLYVEDIEFGSGPPSIRNLSREPCAPTVSDNEVAVSCVISDNSTISEASVHYSVDGGDYASVAMQSTDDSTFTGVIPVANANTVFYYITATDDGVDQSEPKSSVYPNNTDNDQLGFHVTDNLTIHMVQETPWLSGNTMYEGCNVTLTGIVTADTAQYNSSYSAYALQNEAGQWNGLIFDTDEIVQISRGDDVSITGLITEYAHGDEFGYQLDGNTRLINADVTVNSSGNNTPAPLVASCEDLTQIAEEVESYEGVLVKLENVTVSSVNAYDWSITDASGMEALIDDDMAAMDGDNAMSELVEGQQLSYIMGIFNYSYGTYKVQIRDMADLGATVGIDDDVRVNPYEYVLHDNFPNPFNPETQIRFSLGGQENVKLVIYDIMGRQVRTLINGDSFNSGFHVLNWNGRDNLGEKVATGMYIYRIKAGDFIADKKMLLVK